MITSKCLVMDGAAFRLTEVKEIPAPAPVRDVTAENELNRLVSEAKARFDACVAREQNQQKQRCAACSVQLDACIQGMKEEIETQVVSMALQLAEVVLRHQLPDRVMLENLIRETLSPISDLRGVRVRVSPAESAALKNPVGTEWPKPPFLEQVELVADPTLVDGDLMIESRNGIYDARLSERLLVLAEKLKERLKHSDANAQTQST